MTSPLFTPSRSPLCCRSEAYSFFCEQLPNLNSTRKLLRAAIAVSMHALDDVDASRVEQRLEVLSLRVRERAPSRSIRALQANLHAVLFDEEGFQGDMERYYSALNSYLPAVLNTRRGLPVTLSLIYKVVGEWAGLRVEGVNAPGHFMVRVRYENSWMIVDPFFGGQVLHREEAFDRIDRVASQHLPRQNALLAMPTHAQWLARLIGNLRQLFATEERHEDLAAMNEFLDALNASQQLPQRKQAAG
jgi:regulator of sirC expression with transglutaminase-like and TPR domain